MILERFQEAHTPGKQHREQRRSKKTAAKLATSRVFMSSSWLWQPFGSCFFSDNGSYFAILLASHQWFGEQPYSWKRLRIHAWRSWPHCIAALLGLGPGHRDRTGRCEGGTRRQGPGHRHQNQTNKTDVDRDRRDGTWPPGPQNQTGAGQTGGPGGPGLRAEAGRGRHRATGTGPPGPAHTRLYQTKRPK